MSFAVTVDAVAGLGLGVADLRPPHAWAKPTKRATGRRARAESSVMGGLDRLKMVLPALSLVGSSASVFTLPSPGAGREWRLSRRTTDGVS
jgi:hypothetical protein